MAEGKYLCVLVSLKGEASNSTAANKPKRTTFKST